MSASSPAAPQALRDGLAAVIAHYNAGRRVEAEESCSALPARHGQHPALLQMLAVLCHERGDAATARVHIAASLAARPDHIPSLPIQALIDQDLFDLGAAETALCRALALQPQHPAAALNLGIVHLLVEVGRVAQLERMFTDRPPPPAFGARYEVDRQASR